MTTPPPTPVAPSPPSPVGLLGTDWTRMPTNARVVALTFDAGANTITVSDAIAMGRRQAAADVDALRSFLS